MLDCHSCRHAAPFMYVCMYVFMYVCMHVCVYVCMYYIYIYIERERERYRYVPAAVPRLFEDLAVLGEAGYICI